MRVATKNDRRRTDTEYLEDLQYRIICSMFPSCLLLTDILQYFNENLDLEEDSEVKPVHNSCSRVLFTFFFLDMSINFVLFHFPFVKNQRKKLQRLFSIPLVGFHSIVGYPLTWEQESPRSIYSGISFAARSASDLSSPGGIRSHPPRLYVRPYAGSFVRQCGPWCLSCLHMVARSSRLCRIFPEPDSVRYPRTVPSARPFC